MPKLLKDLYDVKYINLLSSVIHTQYPLFDQKLFVSSIFNKEWKDKELKERMHHIADTLYAYLPNDYATSISILKNTFSKINYDFNLQNMIFQDFVERYGLDYFEISMDALEHFTTNSSSEFAIRKFILKHPNQTMQVMQKWAHSNNFHVRRLASEGCRPRLPWAIALQEFKSNPTEVLKIIDILKDDVHPYVQKSVANNINDISKDNPDIVKELASKWIENNKNTYAILKHGCRSLLKQSDRKILDIFGYSQIKNLKIVDFSLDKHVFLGESLHFSFSLESFENLGKLRVEFALYFLRKNNTLHKKVFMLSQGEYKDNNKSFKKHYSFKNITTRKYYKGKHKLQIIVNGNTIIEDNFILS